VPKFLSIPPLANERWIVHGFSTVELGSMGLTRTHDADSVTESRRRFARSLRLKPEWITVAGAVHSAQIARVDRPLPLINGVDGLITDRKGVALFATFADCLPLVVYDAARPAVGLAHAGWRGSEAGIARELVAKMKANYGSVVAELRVGIGPGICGRCYEVGPEFAERFPVDVLAPGEEGKLRLDLAELNRRQFVDAGVDPKRIRALEFCTYESDRLFSHRRNPDGSRFAGIVALR
jgi:YfiH family protein